MTIFFSETNSQICKAKNGPVKIADKVTNRTEKINISFDIS